MSSVSWVVLGGVGTGVRQISFILASFGRPAPVSTCPQLSLWSWSLMCAAGVQYRGASRLEVVGSVVSRGMLGVHGKKKDEVGKRSEGRMTTGR